MYLVAHAPSSVQRLEDFAKMAFNLPFVEALVITKPSGVAAQVGLPEVSKMAYKLDRKLIILPDIDDAIELLKPQRVYTVSYDFGEKVDRIDIVDGTMIIVGLSDPGLTKVEAAKGEAVYPSIAKGDIGPIAAVSALLSGLRS